jgi:hypothetical protein
MCEWFNEVGYDADAGHSPSKSQMRAGIRWRVELSETEAAAASDGPFTKDDLEAIARHLDPEATRGE